MRRTREKGRGDRNKPDDLFATYLCFTLNRIHFLKAIECTHPTFVKFNKAWTLCVNHIRKCNAFCNIINIKSSMDQEKVYSQGLSLFMGQLNPFGMVGYC